MTDQTVAAGVASGPHPGFGMSGGLPDVMAMASNRVQAVSDAVSAMLRDAGEAPFRVHQAAMLLTDNGDLGSIGTVLGAAIGWLAVTVLAAVLLRRILRPARVAVAEPDDSVAPSESAGEPSPADGTGSQENREDED